MSKLDNADHTRHALSDLHPQGRDAHANPIHDLCQNRHLMYKHM